jgi:hypothetical protein
VFDTPSAASNTIRARCAEPAITVEDRVNETNVSRSPSRNPSGAIRMHDCPKPVLSNQFVHAALADVSLTHGEYDGTYFSTGTAPLGDQNTVQLVYTETSEGEFDLIGRLDGTLDTLGIGIPAKTGDNDTDIPEPGTGAS